MVPGFWNYRNRGGISTSARLQAEVEGGVKTDFHILVRQQERIQQDKEWWAEAIEFAKASVRQTAGTFPSRQERKQPSGRSEWLASSHAGCRAICSKATRELVVAQAVQDSRL